MGLVDEVFYSLLGDEEDLVEEEEGSLILSPVHVEGSLQNELPVRGQIWSLPVDQQRLYFLHRAAPNNTPESKKRTKRTTTLSRTH